jgi:hypothetical protein
MPPSAEAKAREQARRKAEAERIKAVRATIPTATTMNMEQWSILIDDWNGLRPSERRERALDCRGARHDYVGTPIRTRVCRRCLAYEND